MSTSWDERYVAIWQKVIDIVKGVKETDGTTLIFDPTNVFWGFKYRVDYFPSAFVCPMPINVKPLTFNFNDVRYDFDIGVVIHHTNPEEGYLRIMKIIGHIYDAFVANKQLDGLVCAVEVVKLTPNWRELGTGIEAFWGGIYIQVIQLGA